MGNCLRTCIFDDSLDSESQSNQFSFESIPGVDQELLIDLPAVRQSPAGTPWTQAELDRFQRLRCRRCLPIGIYLSRDQAAGGSTQECAICLVDFIDGERIRILPCKHFFHLDCIGQWLMLSFTCPCCRQSCNTLA